MDSTTGQQDGKGPHQRSNIATAESESRQSPRQHTARLPSSNSTQGLPNRNTPDSVLLGHEDDAPDQLPPPPYSEVYGQIESNTNGVGTNATVSNDGRVDISINEKSQRLSTIILPALRELDHAAQEPPLPSPYIPPSLGGAPGQTPPPRLNIVIHVVGSRGDVQPFVALGKVLNETYGHRIRLATHPVFQGFVEENGLEFFSIGGDPAELMSFMVKNPGLMPGFDTLRSGEIGKRRKTIGVMIRGCWRSCFETGNGLDASSSKRAVEEWLESGNTNHVGEIPNAARPFIADAIIANPPSFAHVHCAEKLGIPLHMMFTMPWSPTQGFPHPLANIKSTNADKSLTNWMSYVMVDMLTWQGLGDVINRFRRDSLGLDPVSILDAPGLLERLKVPFTYCWSPALIPKCKDWRNHINISGFYFLSSPSTYQPDPDLAAFLNGGPPPVYIGFGSIVVDDPNAMTKLIFEAVKRTGQRALVSKGWGGLGGESLEVPDGVFLLGNVPHDFLFPRVSCVVHHGGAGTTAAGISAGKPTVIVPFFGDQPFWGAMVAKAGAGPEPIPHETLTSDNLAAAILQALDPSSIEKAKELAQKISSEQGTHKGAQYFHQMLNADSIRCDLAPSHVAVWRVRRSKILLSPLAVTVLLNQGELTSNDVKLHRSIEYQTDVGARDPVSGGASAIVSTFSEIMLGVADFPKETLKGLGIAKKQFNDANVSDRGSAIGENSSARSSHQSLATPTTEMASSRDRDMHRRDASPLASLRKSSAASISATPASSVSENNKQKGKETDDPKFTVESAKDTGKGIARIVGASMKSPMDFSLAVSRGFHNVPRLYGQEVRQVEKVTGLSSGLRIAAKEFGYGLYDGITGLVRDPYQGAKQEGGVGFLKGVGTGIAGITLKPSAGAFAIPAYGMQGLYRQLQRPPGTDVSIYIIAARSTQGHEEFQICSPTLKDDILRKWHSLKAAGDIKAPRNKQLEALQTMLDNHRNRSKSEHRLTSKKTAENQASTPSSSFNVSSQAVASNSTLPLPPRDNESTWSSPSAAANRSSGHELDENELMERAIQASIAELERSTAAGEFEGNEDAALQRALQASVAEVSANGATENEQREIEEALRRSVLEQYPPRSSRDDDDTDYYLALEESRRANASNEGSGSPDEDDDLRRAMDESHREEARAAQETQKQLDEERIVLEFVKKQSLAEEEHRRRMLAGKDSREL